MTEKLDELIAGLHHLEGRQEALEIALATLLGIAAQSAPAVRQRIEEDMRAWRQAAAEVTPPAVLGAFDQVSALLRSKMSPPPAPPGTAH